jgi:hypothetical protein
MDGVWIGIGFMGFVGLLRLITTSTVALSLIHTLCNSLEHALALLSLLCLHRLSSANTPKAADPSAAVLPGSRPRSLVTISQYDSAFLRNGLEQWGLLRLPRLRRRRLSQPRADSDSLPPSSKSTRPSTDLAGWLAGKLLLILASTMILGSESNGTHDLTL